MSVPDAPTHHPDHHHHRDIRQRGGFVISGLTSGHGVFHWFTQSFLAMLPEVQQTFRLTEVGVGGITATREIVSGLVTLPGGVITDALRKHWGLVLALCMGAFGVGWLVMGLSPVYPLLLAGMAIVAMAASIWHLPAIASLSHHFSHHRGTALSFHSVGGQIGDAIAAPITGVLLVILAWRQIISFYAIAPLLLAFLVFWAFRRIGETDGSQAQPTDRRDQWRLTKQVLRNPILWAITVVGGIRGMAFLAIATFLPIYLYELGMNPLVRNLHLGLLMAVGIVSTPIVGYLSDRFGRKAMLIPGLILLAAVSFYIGYLGDGAMGDPAALGDQGGITGGFMEGVTFDLASAGVSVALIIAIALLGLFLFGDQPIITAMALDITGHGVASTTLGVLSFSRFTMSAASPLIAGALYQYAGATATFVYIAALFALAAVILLPLPVRPRDPDHDHHAHN